MDIALLQDAFREDPTQSLLVLLLGAAVAFGASQLLYWVFSESAKPIPFTVKEDGDEDVGAAQHKGITAEIQNGKIYPKCPADGRFLSSNPIIPATPADIDNAVAKAAAAQKDWSRTTFAQRRQFLATLLQYVNTHQDSIVRASCLDSGKTKIDASFGEILVTVEKLQWTINHGEAALLPSSRSTNLLMCYKRNTIVYEPLGVVAACFSWNYPFHSWTSNVISALFSGNAIVLKPSEQTCWSSQYFHRITSAALTACGHSPDLVQNLVCLPDTADYLTSHPGISHITFIGSRTIAHKVCSSAAKSLTPVCVELGGKDPAIVLDDPKTIKDIDSVVSILMRGTFQSAGQNCIGIERIIALPDIHDLLVSKMESKIKNLRLGSALDPSTPDTIDMGAMISSASFPRLTSLVQSAVQAGATLHHGGTPYQHPSYPNGTYFTPTLLSNVPPDHPIAQQELFAPVCLIFRADSLTHALSLANGTEYGLGASVFGHHRPSIRRVVREIKSGMISVNDFGSYYACSMPFGGIKGSGYGRFSGAEGLQALCNPKSVCEDAMWARMLGIKTEIPPILQYPVKGIRGWEACKGIIGTGYGIGISQRVGGLTALLGALLRSGSADPASQPANGHARKQK